MTPGGEVGAAPSERFLREGVPNRSDRRAIETLSRRRDYLTEELVIPDYLGSSYDRREVSAISWALELVATLRREGGLDGSGPLPGTDRDG